MTSGSGKGTKSGGRCLVEKGTHRPGLPEKSLHCDGSDVEGLDAAVAVAVAVAVNVNVYN